MISGLHSFTAALALQDWDYILLHADTNYVCDSLVETSIVLNNKLCPPKTVEVKYNITYWFTKLSNACKTIFTKDILQTK